MSIPSGSIGQSLGGLASVGHVPLHETLRTELLAVGAYLMNVPGCRVYNNANISLTTNVETALTFNTERFDRDNMHSTVTNTGRITFTTAGIYIVTGHVAYAASATGVREIKFRLSGTTNLASQKANATSSGTTRLTLAMIYQFAAADWIDLTAFQDSGGALNVLAAGNDSPEIAAMRLG